MRQLARRSLLRALASGVASAALLAGMLAGAGSAAAAVTGPAAAAQPAAAARAAAAAHLAAPGGAAAAAQAAAVLNPAATTVTSCQVTYTVQSDWGTGFTAAITIENTGSAITSWTLGYSYAGQPDTRPGLVRELDPERQGRHGDQRELERQPGQPTPRCRSARTSTTAAATPPRPRSR